MREQRRALARYVNAATDLAESIKKDIQKGGKIDSKTVIRLNEFSIAANEVAYLIQELNKRTVKYDN